MRSQEKVVLPYMNASRLPLIMWSLVIFFLITLGAVWWNRIPVYTVSMGILLEDHSSVSPSQKQIVAVVFLPAHASQPLRPGSPTQLQIGTGAQGVVLTGQIERMVPNIVSPQDLRKRYNLNGGEALIVTQPSLVVIVRVISPVPVDSTYAGSIVTAQIQTGEQSLLSMLSGMASQ